jgi:hypothetical protein
LKDRGEFARECERTKCFCVKNHYKFESTALEKEEEEVRVLRRFAGLPTGRYLAVTSPLLIR